MDITGIYVSLNRMPERWVEFQTSTLLKALGDAPLLSFTRVPMKLGENFLDTDKPGYVNIYRQMLRGAKMATTKYVAMVEDDCLYPREHFVKFRPNDDEVAYNRNRWSLFTWGEPMYSMRQRLSNCSLIAPRELLVEALQERFDKWGDAIPEGWVGEVGRNKLETKLGLKLRKQVDFLTNSSIVQLNHPLGTEDKQQGQWKSHAEIRAYDIPVWGKAKDIVSLYKQEETNVASRN